MNIYYNYVYIYIFIIIIYIYIYKAVRIAHRKQRKVGLNASSTSLIRKISNSKHYPAEKPPNEISCLESTDMLQT